MAGKLPHGGTNLLFTTSSKPPWPRFRPAPPERVLAACLWLFVKGEPTRPHDRHRLLSPPATARKCSTVSTTHIEIKYDDRVANAVEKRELLKRTPVVGMPMLAVPAGGGCESP